MTGGSAEDIKKCIHVGLLCVQEKAALRPTMASIVVMLNSETATIQRPSRPAFLLQDSLRAESTLQAGNHSRSTNSVRSASPSEHVSVNEATISELDPRIASISVLVLRLRYLKNAPSYSTLAKGGIVMDCCLPAGRYFIANLVPMPRDPSFRSLSSFYMNLKLLSFPDRCGKCNNN